MNQEADLILLVMDSAQPAPQFPENLTANLAQARTLVVGNKSDLPPHGNLAECYAGYELVMVSALTGDGLERLQAAIVRRADAFSVPHGEDIIAINARHADALGRAQTCLESSVEKLQAHEASELVASELRGALDAWGDRRQDRQ